jgi:hypothetical protein
MRTRPARTTGLALVVTGPAVRPWLARYRRCYYLMPALLDVDGITAPLLQVIEVDEPGSVV